MLRADRRPLAVLLAVLLLLGGCATPGPPASAPPFDPTEGPCHLWYAIGDTPTDAELDAVAGRYGVVVLNSWETAALARLRAADPTVTVLVYKDLSSARSYDGALVDGVDPNGEDAAALPTGVGFREAEREGWFATDTAGARIEWDGYPEHWQTAVWDPGYRARWTDNVVTEALDAGWDGVFADNDFARLGFYSPAVLAGTADADASDRLIRDGLDALVDEAGAQLRRAGKVFVPNVSEARLFPGRWERHTRFGGGMEEHFAYFDAPDDDTAAGGGEFLIADDPTGWLPQTAQAGLADRLTLLVTRTAPDDGRAQRYGYASALVRGAGRVCWTVNTTGVYTQPEWTPAQDVVLGGPVGTGEQDPSGAWTREFQGGWAAVNPTAAPVRITPPDGIPGGPVDLPATDAIVVGRE